MMRSVTGDRPVISRSIQIRLFSFSVSVASVIGMSFSVSGGAILAQAYTSPPMQPSLVTAVSSPFAVAVAGRQVLAGDAPDAARRPAPQRRCRPAFAATCHLAGAPRAADYTLAKAASVCWPRLGTAVLLGWTLLGGPAGRLKRC